MSNVEAKARRIRRTRRKIFELNCDFLMVHKTPKHIYAQVYSKGGKNVIVSASSVEKEVRGQDFGSGKIKTAEAIGKLVAERAKAKGIKRVAFDRSGYRFHGRIKAVADAARANGLEF